MRRTVLLLLVVAALTTAGCGAGAGRPPAAPGQASATTAASAATSATTAAGMETAVAAGSSATGFRGSISAIGPGTRKRMRFSWRRGCPVGPVELRLLRVDHWGLDRRVHQGELVVHRDHARRILRVMARLFEVRYPIQRLRLVDAYRADDDRSMAANNTSAFNCRRVSGTNRWSEHAYGRAIDVNPLRNPYVTRGGRVSPPAGRPSADRSKRARGMIHGGDAVVRAFAAAGWEWGGYWRGARDYQHFSSTGG
jgi:D-alanyl-D-alanine carboxypeptidase-like protein